MKERTMQDVDVARDVQSWMNDMESRQTRYGRSVAQLLALSDIDKSFEEGQEWLKAFLLFEVSENTIRSETRLVLLEVYYMCFCLAIQTMLILAIWIFAFNAGQPLSLK